MKQKIRVPGGGGGNGARKGKENIGDIKIKEKGKGDLADGGRKKRNAVIQIERRAEEGLKKCGVGVL